MPSSTTEIATYRAGTHQRSPANGRICCDQPIGLNQDSQRGPSSAAESPAARNRYAAPITIPPIPLAARELELTWTATAVTAEKNHTQPPMPSPIANDPVAGNPWLARARPINSAYTTPAPNTTISAAVSLACRPTTPAPSSSCRPVSSSARVCRTVMNTAISPTRTQATAPYFHSVMPPTVSSPWAGPLSASTDGLVTIVAANSCRDCTVGYSWAKLDAVAATMPVMTRIQTGSWIRSRRSTSRTRDPVPTKVFTPAPRSAAGTAAPAWAA